MSANRSVSVLFIFTANMKKAFTESATIEEGRVIEQFSKRRTSYILSRLLFRLNVRVLRANIVHIFPMFSSSNFAVCTSITCFAGQERASFHFGKVPTNNVLSIGTVPTNNAIHFKCFYYFLRIAFKHHLRNYSIISMKKKNC